LPLLLIVFITFFQFLIRTWRWDILMEPIKKTSFLNRLAAVLIGFAANSILPARLGEFIRANTLGQREGIKGSSAFGTIVVERLFDGFTLLLVLMIGLLGTTFPKEWSSISGSLRGTGIFLLFSYLILIGLLVGFKVKTKSFLNLLDRVLFFIPSQLRSKIIDLIRHFSLGLVLMKSPKKWLQVIFFSVLLWATSLYQIELTEQSLGLDLPFIAAFLILAMASLGVMIPSAPGFVGTFHLSVQYGFIFYGIAREEALSAAVLWHAAMIFPTIFLGFIAFLLIQIFPSNLPANPDTVQGREKILK
ncbi:MAG: lysylphosphatidylglycerol synthase transmembrane domain-containing protein, partial [Pseudomonadota bacterium]